MFCACFVTLFALTVSTSATAVPAAAPPARPRLAKGAHPARRDPAPAREFRSDQLFSLRERRRIAAYLRMRLLEMREAAIERAAEAVERRLPPGALLEGSGPIDQALRRGGRTGPP
jgi:hypothetical protein